MREKKVLGEVRETGQSQIIQGSVATESGLTLILG